jgi:nucleotide-binding universal stress UspA family protein
MKAFQRILFATDLTPASMPAFEEVIELAAHFHAELIVVHAYEPPNIAQATAVGGGVYEEWDQNLRNESEARLAPLIEQARRAGIRARSLLVSGSPGETIAQEAESTAADLVVMGTHGRKGVSRLFLGSVASHVISTAHCPVMTVRAA